MSVEAHLNKMRRLMSNLYSINETDGRAQAKWVTYSEDCSSYTPERKWSNEDRKGKVTMH